MQSHEKFEQKPVTRIYPFSLLKIRSDLFLGFKSRTIAPLDVLLARYILSQCVSRESAPDDALPKARIARYLRDAYQSRRFANIK